MPKNSTPEPGMSSVTHLPIGSINVDRTVQQRVEMSDALIAEYASDIPTWFDQAPVVVYDDGTSVWLADGYHRIYAAGQIEMETVPAVVHQGTRRDATLYAVAANRTHGLRRSSADKRRCCETMLLDPEWATWSDRRIADHVGVDHKTVGAVRGQVGNFPTCDAQQDQPPPDPPSNQVEKFTTCETPQTRIQPEPQTDQVRKFSTCDAPQDQPPAKPFPPAEPEPRKRIGRDGKAYTPPKAKPKEDHNKARVAMQAAHAVTVALVQLRAVEADLLESDARTLLANLGKALDRLAARFSVATTEGADNA